MALRYANVQKVMFFTAAVVIINKIIKKIIILIYKFIN
jgi:hypothetical protein